MQSASVLRGLFKRKTMKKGQKLNLNINGKERIYEVKEVENGMVKLFNKFVISFWMSIKEIESNLVVEN